jgi:hypothetical protein
MPAKFGDIKSQYKFSHALRASIAVTPLRCRRYAEILSYTDLRTSFIDPRGACVSGAFQGLKAVPSQKASRAGVSITCRINVIRPMGRNGDSSVGHSTNGGPAARG